MRRVLLAAALIAAAPAMTPAWAAGVDLALDEVHTVTFKNPVATVYVGNPAIADITMIDARHAFVQGKSYGRTNIVALNHDGQQVFNTSIMVTGGDSDGIVTLNRGAQRITYSCAGGRCEPTPMPGDAPAAFDAATGQANQHQSAAKGAATGEGQKQ
jgi:hypothetical protein